jgi:hypothetical protein
MIAYAAAPAHEISRFRREGHGPKNAERAKSPDQIEKTARWTKRSVRGMTIGTATPGLWVRMAIRMA